MAGHSAATLAVDMRIYHSKFGPGVITKVDTSGPDHRIYVKFDNEGADALPRMLLLKYSRFAILPS